MDAGGGMEAGAGICFDVAVGMYADVVVGMDADAYMYIDGANAAMDVAADCAAITSFPWTPSPMDPCSPCPH
jgi:hypothetical protein